jgi:hypothetical protein
MSLTQRWRERRDTYRPAGEPIQTRDYEVAPIRTDGPAKAFIVQHHYSGCYPAARFRFGLYRHGALVGVAVFSHPCNNATLSNVFDRDPAVELGRFVLLDDVPANGETWFLGQTFALLKRESVEGVVSFSDPVPRTTSDGRRVFPGHIGTIYQAHNAVYLGRSTMRTLRLLPDGRVFSDRAIQKIRKKEKGWRYSAGQLEAHGATPPDGPGWLAAQLTALTRRLRHPGNHRYAWSLTRKRSWPKQSYPKLAA